MFSAVRTITIFSVFLLTMGLAAVSTAGQSGGKLEDDPPSTGPYTPERNSPERKAIVDALRVPVQKQLKQPVIFRIDQMTVQKGFAFVRAYPQKPDGSAIDYTGTVYQDAIDAGAFDEGVIGLLKNVSGRWRVIQYVLGATDVPWVDWDKKYKAPKGIFRID